MVAIMIVVFVIGYLMIASEHVLKINKAVFALLMCGLLWATYSIGTHDQDLSYRLVEALGDTCEIVVFLIGAMTIVELIDKYDGFAFITRRITAQNKRNLMWVIAFLSFFMSAILDNMTTTIIMVMMLRRLISNNRERWKYAGVIIISANSGGAWSPIGDVTTIMLWNKGVITAAGVISEIIVPSLVSMIIPAFIMQYMLKGNLADVPAAATKDESAAFDFSDFQRKVVFVVGVGGLIFVPIFKAITHLPPFVGILLVLGVLWTVTEAFYRHLPHGTDREGTQKRVTNLLHNIDMSTILFFLGILMAVACLEEVGVLTALGEGLNVVFSGNHYMVTGIIGVLSSIVDNVPLVAGCMGMYPVAPTGDMAVDGVFWQLLAYCAGVGGSMLIIGSAAGVVVMGLEKITFGWYMKHITWIAFVGYLAGIVSYWCIRTFIFTTPL